MYCGSISGWWNQGGKSRMEYWHMPSWLRRSEMFDRWYLSSIVIWLSFLYSIMTLHFCFPGASNFLGSTQTVRKKGIWWSNYNFFEHYIHRALHFVLVYVWLSIGFRECRFVFRGLNCMFDFVGKRCRSSRCKALLAILLHLRLNVLDVVDVSYLVFYYFVLCI